MNSTGYERIARILARTHGGPESRNGLDSVQNYQRVPEYTAKLPTKESFTVISTLDLLG
jgi:hypothetical protein